MILRQGKKNRRIHINTEYWLTAYSTEAVGGVFFNQLEGTISSASEACKYSRISYSPSLSLSLSLCVQPVVHLCLLGFWWSNISPSCSSVNSTHEQTTDTYVRLSTKLIMEPPHATPPVSTHSYSHLRGLFTDRALNINSDRINRHHSDPIGILPIAVDTE